MEYRGNHQRDCVQQPFGGTRQKGGVICFFYWVLVLPDRFIDVLVQGETLDVSVFPQHQLNLCLRQVLALVQANSVSEG